MSSLTNILNSIRESSPSERDKGSDFERLIKFYLQNDPAYDFSDVWLWSDWAKEQGVDSRDLGIDLVAKEKDSEIFWAIQCKFYAERTKIYKRHIDSFFTESGKEPFGHRLIVMTTSEISEHVESAKEKQHIPCSVLDLAALEESPIDWSKYAPEKKAVFKPRKQLRPHQQTALDNTVKGLKLADRGKLLMACGTGKTFTALKIAEEIAGRGGRVLFLVPSLSLLSQTLREWTADSELPLYSFAVCSDTSTGKRKKDDDSDITISDLAFPATTKADSLATKLGAEHKDKLTVAFSTYQSIKVISEAQKKFDIPDFDLIICDEAHRTTGATLAGEDESHFVKVHDNDFIKAKKRIYMTATPRIFGDAVKSKAEEAEATLCSMDNVSLFGETLYTLNFSEAVSKGLLSDYKVLVLAVDEGHISKSIQNVLVGPNSELKLDDATKIIGCWKALGKQSVLDEFKNPNQAMQRAVAFCKDIKTSKRICDFFPEVVEEYVRHENIIEEDSLLCEAKHVDGTDNAVRRKTLLDWLNKGGSDEERSCHILSNARCLSEGVDVPSLDAIMFLNPRKSQIDIVQAVGRVMRKAPGKSMGFVILPIAIPAGAKPEDVLSNNERYRVIWQVLQALRAHDDRFDAIINKLEFDADISSKMEVIAVTQNLKDPSKQDDKQGPIGIGEGSDSEEVVQDSPIPFQTAFNLEIGDLEKAIYAKIVQKCGNRKHWEDWAGDIAKIAQTHITRIETALEKSGTRERKAFDAFLEEIRDDLNESIRESDAVEMLAQHIITRPVFDALFEGTDFAKQNPVSIAMQETLDILGEHNLENESDSLHKFYESVRYRASGIDSPEGKQKIIYELYDKFFRNAFPQMTEQLGIVYTPVEVVDFIIHSVNDVLKMEFGETLGSKGVHILDPFAGTGTFITRLLQSGLINPKELKHKYENEIHANEIVLLAYYIAAINIEATYHSITQEEYRPFEGICLTDTFQLYEKEDLISKLLVDNTNRRNRQKELDIRVILGNPPYSAGQRSANDNAANVEYPSLDESIQKTYAKYSSATNKNALYDSYIRAIRWATDHSSQRGVVAYVTNAGWIDGNATDGLRKCLAEEYSNLYIFHLRGNQRTQGEQSRKEGGKIFGSGSRSPIAISVFVKNPESKKSGQIFFHDIGDYLSREEKLGKIENFKSIDGIAAAKSWQKIEPDKYNDWLSQRDDSFDEFIVLGDKKDKKLLTLFKSYSNGIKTNSDAWCYNFSLNSLSSNMEGMIGFYNSEIERYACANKNVAFEDFVDRNPTKISWHSSSLPKAARGVKGVLKKHLCEQSLYRPFQKTWLYYDPHFVQRVAQMPRIFPNGEVDNRVIAVTGRGSTKEFSCLILDCLPDLEVISKSQCFPLKLYEQRDNNQSPGLFDQQESESGYSVKDGITDEGQKHFQTSYPGEKITKEDIFYYTYGLLHSDDYRERYADNLSKQLPRIPCVKKAEDFWKFSKAGRDLADLHVDYEEVDPYPVKFKGDINIDSLSESDLRVKKMKFGKGKDKTTVIYNSKITITDIPIEAYDYVVNGKPALEWVIERQCVSIDKKSGIENDANRYAVETVRDPAYPLKLFQRVITVSLETMKIVRALPELDI